MKKIYLLLVLCSILGCTGCAISAKPDLSYNVQKFVNLETKWERDKALDIYKNFTDAEKTEFAQYLEENQEKFPPFYFVAMADFVFKTDKNKAVLWYNVGKMRSMQDVRMCEDKTARGQTAMYSLIAPNTTGYMQQTQKNGDKNYMISTLKEVLAWDKAHPKRVSPIWSCYHGAQVFYKPGPPALLPKSEFPKIQKEVRKNFEELIKLLEEGKI